MGWGFHNEVLELRAEGEWAPSGLAPPLSSYPGLSEALSQDLTRWLCSGWHQLSLAAQSLNQGKDLWIGGKREEQELLPQKVVTCGDDAVLTCADIQRARRLDEEVNKDADEELALHSVPANITYTSMCIYGPLSRYRRCRYALRNNGTRNKLSHGNSYTTPHVPCGTYTVRTRMPPKLLIPASSRLRSRHPCFR